MKTETKIIKMREILEKDNDNILPMLDRHFEEASIELVHLYQRLEKIDSDEQITFSEIQTELYKADKTYKKQFLILVASLFLSGVNKRDVLGKIGIHNILSDLAGRQLLTYDIHFESIINKVFIADVLKKNVTITNKQIRSLLEYRLKNVHYSERIWRNTYSLNDKLYNIFTNGFQNGWSQSKMVTMLSSQMEVGYMESFRLIKTELTAVISSAQLDYFEKAGITKVQHISTLDNRTSAICEERHLLIINIEDAVIGENVPPLHPYCRSVIVPFEEADGR